MLVWHKMSTCKVFCRDLDTVLVTFVSTKVGFKLVNKDAVLSCRYLTGIGDDGTDR
jgi:hypothetical protein